MGFFARGVRPATEWKSTDNTLELFKQIFGTNTSATGETITWKTAIQVAAVLACARVRANGIAQVPFKLFQESEDGRSRNPAKDHPLYWVLHRKPNPWQSSFEFRQTMGLHLTLCNNAFAFKNEVDGRVVELLQFEPGRMSVDRLSSGELTYKYTAEGGKTQNFPQESIWHLREMSWNSWMGMEAVQLARESIGLSMATEKQQATLFKNGAQMSGTYSVKQKLSKTQYEDLRAWIVENTSGDNTGAPLILDNGAEWLQQSMTGIDSQQLETRRHQVEEVCRAFGVFPQMVGYSDKTATFASAEQFFIAHVVHTLAPLYEMIEQSVSVNLLSELDMKSGFYPKFIEEGLLRGSTKETADMLDKYVNGGLMTPNEARAKLDLNPDEDSASDKLRIPANIVGKDAAGNDPAEPDGSTTGVAGTKPKPGAPARPAAVAQPADDGKMAALMGAVERLAAEVRQIKSTPAPVMQPQPPITVNVSPPSITVNVPEQAAPQVTVNNESPQINVSPAAITVEGATINVEAAPIPQVNVTNEIPAPNVTVESPTVNVEAPTVNVEAPAVTVESPTVNVAAPTVNVEAPTVNVAPPEVNVAAPNVMVTVEKPDSIQLTEDATGKVTGALIQ